MTLATFHCDLRHRRSGQKVSRLFLPVIRGTAMFTKEVFLVQDFRNGPRPRVGPERFAGHGGNLLDDNRVVGGFGG